MPRRTFALDSERFTWTILRAPGTHSSRKISVKRPRASTAESGCTKYTPSMTSDGSTRAFIGTAVYRSALGPARGHRVSVEAMGRSIKTLRNADKPATEQEVSEAALQYVRKVSGYRAPAKRNTEAFDEAVREITEA